MLKANKSRIILYLFCITLFELLYMIVTLATVDWVFVGIIAPPVLLIMFMASRLDKVSYVLLIYWLLILSVKVRVGEFGFSVGMGFAVQLPIFGDIIKIDFVAVMLLILVLMEWNKIFQKDIRTDSIVEVKQDNIPENNGNLTSGSS